MAQATIDFTSSPYLGIRHPSRSLRTWLQLTTGKPAGPARVMQPYIQLDPDRLPDAVRLKLAKDVVDGRAWQKAVARQVAPRAAGAQQYKMAFIATRMLVLRGRPPATPRGSATPAARTRHPSDRLDSRRPPAYKSDGASRSTSPIAIAMNTAAVNHAFRGGGNTLLGQALTGSSRLVELTHFL